MTTDERLVELEIRYTQLQDLVQELSDALVAQQKELDALRGRLKGLEDKAPAPSHELAADEKPPHY